VFPAKTPTVNRLRRAPVGLLLGQRGGECSCRRGRDVRPSRPLRISHAAGDELPRRSGLPKSFITKPAGRRFLSGSTVPPNLFQATTASSPGPVRRQVHPETSTDQHAARSLPGNTHNRGLRQSLSSRQDPPPISRWPAEKIIGSRMLAMGPRLLTRLSSRPRCPGARNGGSTFDSVQLLQQGLSGAGSGSARVGPRRFIQKASPPFANSRAASLRTSWACRGGALSVDGASHRTVERGHAKCANSLADGRFRACPGV